MEFRDIEYVCAIATYKSITKAAESLFITQPTLSQYIKNMEKRLGVEIFYREGNHIYPTYEGNIFIEEGKKLIRDRDILINMLNDSIQKERGTLKIAVPLQRGSALLSAILPKFHQQFPNVEIQLEEGSINHLVKHVKEGFSDLVFFNKPTFSTSLQYEHLSTEELLLITNEDSPLIEKSRLEPGKRFPIIDLMDCREYPFIIHHADQHTGQIEREIFKQAGYRPNIILQTRNLEASCRLSMSGYGLSFLSESHLNRLGYRPNVQALSIDNIDTNMDVVVGYRSKDSLSKSAQAFITLAKNIYSKTV